MSDTPEGAWDSGSEGFAPPDGGFVSPAGVPPAQDAVPMPIPISIPAPMSIPMQAQAPGYAPQMYPVYPTYQGALGPATYPGYPAYQGAAGPPAYPGMPGGSPAYLSAPGYPGFPTHPGGYYGPPTLRKQTSGLAVTGMVLGMLSLLLFWAWLLALLLALLGIVFSALGISQCSKPGWTGMGMAVTGLVCALLTAMIWVALAILVASLIF